MTRHYYFHNKFWKCETTKIVYFVWMMHLLLSRLIFVLQEKMQHVNIIQLGLLVTKNITMEFYMGQTMYNPQMQQQPQYYNQLYGASSSALGSPYYYGYAPRGAFSMAAAQRMPGPSYLYYPTQVEGTSLTYPPTPHPLPSPQPIRHSLPSSAGKSLLFYFI